MATATTTPQSWNRDDSQQRVRHPLQRLRGYIRSYVSAEGLAVVGLYLALCFWIGLLLDYGFFKAFGVDWVQELPWGFRAVVLCGLVAGLLVLLVFKMIGRLLREFRDSSLALVLERRFPKELGDRLITAVELADPRLAQRYGYSQLMIDQTVRAAAERVDRLPVSEVFDWRRLRRAATWLVLLTCGLYLLVGAGYCLIALIRGQPAGVTDFAVRFNTVAGIWFERNILLRDTIWPRRAHLEIVRFPESGELRIGRNAQPPTIRVRALKWVIADPRAYEGWRAMNWSDLTPDLLGADLPTDILPAAWQGWTIDQIELQLDKPEAHAALDADTRINIQNVLAQLHARAESPRMARRFRDLQIPDEVKVYYQGETVRSDQSLSKLGDNEYSGVLSDLKESVRFRANGEDYYTPYKRITVVPPPNLAELTRHEERPAYLYHRVPAGGEAKDLRGKKQLFRDLPISLSGAISRIDVPAGTNVVLKGRADKDLRLPGGVRLHPLQGSAALNVSLQQHEDEQSFEVRFDNVTAPFDFEIELTDKDNVGGRRHVMIKPLEDTIPDVDVLVEVIRKTTGGYMVTASAKIPFSGKVRDDHGLDSVQYAYTLASLDVEGGSLARPALSVLQFSPRGLGPHLLAPLYLAWVGKVTKALADEANKPPEKTELDTFARRLKEKALDDVPLSDFLKRLRMTPVPSRDRQLDPNTEFPDIALIKDHTLDPEEEFFDVEKLRLKVSDERQIQPRYRMRLWMVATDNNIETGPGIGESKEKFTFLIVSENELLVEIAKEEEALHLKLDDTVKKLRESQAKLDQVMQEIPALKKEEFSPMARRAEEIIDTLAKSLLVCEEIYVDYRRILKELQVNRVHPQLIEKVERSICDQLDGAIHQEFVRSDQSMQELRKVLDEATMATDLKAARDGATEKATPARKDLEELIARLRRVLDAMGDITNLNELIKQLIEMEKEERKSHDKLRDIVTKKINDLLEGTQDSGSQPEGKKPEEKNPEEKNPKP